MDAYWLDWANLLLRWAHVVTGIAWIGASFYFVGLDNSLTPPATTPTAPRASAASSGPCTAAASITSRSTRSSPARLPEHLHWSMWESYSTWLTGFALFTVLYLFNAGTFLIDRSVHDWSPAAAVEHGARASSSPSGSSTTASAALFGASKNGDLVVGVLVFGFIVFASWLSCHLFAGRAAFLLVGAMMATTMTGNVAHWIIPGQRKVVAALRAGTPVDPVHGRRGKQRSVHNTYFTLPVVFTMHQQPLRLPVSARGYNWLVLVLLMLAGALIRVSFVLRHKALAEGRAVPWQWAIAGTIVLAGTVVFLMPAPPPAAVAPAPVPTFAEVQAVVGQRCQLCHNASLNNKGVRLDSPAEIAARAQQIYQQAVVLKLMPMNNATQMTDCRARLAGPLVRGRRAALRAAPDSARAMRGRHFARVSCACSQAKNSAYQRRALRGLRIQWFSSGNQTRRASMPRAFSVL